MAVSSGPIQPLQVVGCPVAASLREDMERWRAGEGWSPAGEWRRDAEPGEELVWLLGRQGRVAGPSTKLAKVLVGRGECDYLHTALPFIIINIAELERCKQVVRGFDAFLLGTHPRLGSASPVLGLRGVHPVLHLLARYCRHQPEVRERERRLHLHLTDMVRVCRIRALLLGLVDHASQGPWTFGLCSLCRQGGDCETGARVNQPGEEELRRREPLTFALLQAAITNIFQERSANMLKSIMMDILDSGSKIRDSTGAITRPR